jgi:hypothetical protein
MTLTRTLGLILGLGLAGLIGACGDDDDGTSADAGPQGQPDAPPGVAQFTVQLTRAAEVPACSSGAASAGGSAMVTVAADGSTIRVMGSYQGLSGAANLMHIHYGAESAMGPVVLNFGTPVTPFDKTFMASDYVAATGAPANFATFVTELKTMQKAYINVHTTNCGTGEIRGQIK